MATTTSAFTRTLTINQRVGLLQYAKMCANFSSELGTFRQILTYRDRAYQSQLNLTADHLKAIRANLLGDARKIADLTVPIVMPQIESAVAYQAGVYLSSWPIFPVVTSPDKQPVADQFQTVMNNHALQYGWTREMIKWFRDGFKYNWGAAFVHWKKTSVTRISTSTDVSTAGQSKVNSVSYGGNCITRIDPYNCFMDMRVDPSKHHEEGEFFGWNNLMNRMAFRRFVEGLDKSRTTNLKEAIESSYQGTGFSDNQNPQAFYIPSVNMMLDINRLAIEGKNWLAWAGLEKQGGEDRVNYKNQYIVTTFICRAMPSDFGAIGQQPTIYLCYIVNWQYVVYVEELVTANDYLPIFIMQPYEDGLGYQTKSLLDNALPFQDMSSALWNISLESQRRKVFDRLIYNERFISKKDIDPVSAVARIPLRNAAMFKGDDIGKAVYQIPYREDNLQASLQMSEMVSQMADVASGQNKVQRGQFQPGNKSVTEFETTMDGSNSRQQLTSMTIEHQAITPLKETLKANMLQNQGTGEMLDRENKQVVKIDPVALRDTMMEFKLTDGLLPIEKLMNPQLLMVFMQTAQAMPVVMSEYDVMGMFMYWMKLKGAWWLEDFKRSPEQQQQFQQMLTQTSAAQNAVPPEQNPNLALALPQGQTAAP
jgi:hypothetical protein